MTSPSRKRTRVLHVLGGMNRGGAETWLMHVLRHIDRERFRLDFLVHTDKPCAYDDEIRTLGAAIIPCLAPRRPWRYARNFLRIMKEYGPYDVIHSHVHHYSGFVLWLAHLAGVPMRIAHSHSDTSAADSNATLFRRAYLRLTERMVRQYATKGLAASGQAAGALFGTEWAKDPRWRILYCGVDLRPFTEPVDPAEVRKELGIPTDAFVVGHVGRFSPVKNHAFLVDIAACLVKEDPDVRVLLVGDGPLQKEIQNKVVRLGLTNHVIFAGSRSDVPRLMMGAMDVFLLPSLHEGLPLVLMEAQAAGLPCVFSHVVSKETDVVPYLVHRTTLDLSPGKWAEKIIDARKAVPMMRKQALELVSQSAFNINRFIKQLEGCYISNRLNYTKQIQH